MKIELFWQIFEKKYSDNKHNENPSGGSRVVPYAQMDIQMGGRTDRNDESNIHFSQFCEDA